MAKYLGEKVVKIKDTKFKDFGVPEWTLYFIERYGQFDGGHHKQWVMDQIVRIIHGTPITIKLASWDNGEREYRITLDEPTKSYLNWVNEMRDGNDGPDTYDYDEGIAP